MRERSRERARGGQTRRQYQFMGSNLKQYVTFYFTNVPDLLPYHCAREGFEVCGIMDNLFLSRKRNKQGHAYGFVRYLNVKDVDKLLKAMNNVAFGQYRV